MAKLPPSADAVLGRVFGQALVRAEVSIAKTRLFVLAVAFVEELVFLGMHPDAAGRVLGWVPAGTLVAGAVVTLFGLRRLRQADAAPRVGSAALDAALIFGVAVPVALAPDAEYTGAFHHPPSVFFLLAIAASGLRMSRPLVRVAAVANAACMALLLAIDVAVGTPGPRVDEWILWTMAFFGVSFLADGMALRARRLAYDAAAAVLHGERARQALDVYVSEEVAEEALTAGVVPGGHRQAVAVLFADLRGFTAYSAEVPAERLVTELNAWFAVLHDVVRHHGGVVDAFMGDGVMVSFGMPRSMPDAASRALRAAVDLQRALVAHNAARVAAGTPPFRLAIGLHYGEVVVGNLGAAERMQYTAIGEAVNLASRLEAKAKELDLSIVASAAVIDIAGRQDGLPVFSPLGMVRVAGRAEPVAAFGLAALG